MSVNIYFPNTFDCAYFFDSEIQEKSIFQIFVLAKCYTEANLL